MDRSIATHTRPAPTISTSCLLFLQGHLEVFQLFPDPSPEKTKVYAQLHRKHETIRRHLTPWVKERVSFGCFMFLRNIKVRRVLP